MFNREKIVDILEGCVYEISMLHMQQLRNIVEQTKQNLKDYIPARKIQSILRGTTPISSLSDAQLYFLSAFLNKNNFIKVDINEFFTQDEIKIFLNEKINDIAVETIIIPETIQSHYKTEFTCKMTYRQLYDLFNNSLLTYNISTQRVSKIKKMGSHTFKVPNINEKNVEAIKEAILQGTFEPNLLTFNIRKTGAESFVFEPVMGNVGKLIINVNDIERKTFCDVIDGWHRLQAISLAYEENSNIQGEMIVTIKNLDIEQARMFINQEAKGTLNNQVDMEMYDVDSNIVKLINDINVFGNRSKNILFNKIITPTHTSTEAIYPFEVFAQNLYDYWGTTLNKAGIEELIQIKRYIIDSYNLFVSRIQEQPNIKTVDKAEALGDPMFMAGLIIPLSKLYQKSTDIDDVVLFLNNAITKIDLSSDSSFTYDNKQNIRNFRKYQKAWLSLI